MEIQVIPSMEIQVSSSTEIQVMNEENVILSTENQVSSSTKNLPDHLSSSTDLAIILLIVGDQFDKKIYAIRAATDEINKLLAWDSLQASPPPIVYLDSRRQALRCDASGAFLDFPFPCDMTSPLITSENTISSLVSTYPSSYVPPIVTSTQSTVISTPVTMLGSLVTCTPDVSTTFPRALLTQHLSTVTIPSIISSSIIPSLSSSSAGVFSSSTFAKAISEVMSVVAMTQDVHSDEVSEMDRLRRRLGEAALHSVTSFMDFKCYSNKIEASLVASKKREADLRAHVLTLETSIKEMEEEKFSRDNEIESLRQKEDMFAYLLKIKITMLKKCGEYALQYGFNALSK
ncbi:hypothetical protein ACFE04_030550 [Oxalis oulophora]